SFVCVSEDFWEGTSIFDEYVPDQLGAVLKPVCTITADGIHGLITAYMQILTGLVDIVVVEGHSKLSDVVAPNNINVFALDPIFNRPLGLNPFFVAGLEMNRYLHETKTTEEHCAMVVEKNKKNALDNPYACYGAKIKKEDVLNSEMIFYPLKSLDVSPPVDGAIVMVLASENVAKSLTENPVWIKGVGWCSDTPSLETRNWSEALYAIISGKMAYKKAGISPREVDIAEIDDTFSYKELQHLEALKLEDEGLPVNVSGGSLGVGYSIEATGLMRIFEVVTQLRGEASGRQIPDVKIGLAQSWRGIPTTSGATIIMGV
ncbi:MAG: acetyl-CoA acetyltransferase, partial [Candidatus Methanofastidiosia archaeon]